MQNMKLEDYLKEEALVECEKWYDHLQNYFAICNLYIFFFSRLNEFGNLFTIATPGEFLRMTKYTYFDMFLIRFHSLVAATDKPSKKGEEEISLTLPNFYKFLVDNAKDNLLRDRFIHNFDKTKFDEWINSIRDRLNIIRNKFIAHLDSKYLVKDVELPEITPLDIAELRKMMSDAESYFEDMCFDVRHTLWFWFYDENRRKNRETDIDKLLQLIAENSNVIKISQEKDPMHWKIYREHLSETKIAKINEVRRKMGLPDVE